MNRHTVFHLISKSDWNSFEGSDDFTAPSLETEGFIHFSTADQLRPTAEVHYSGQSDLLVLQVEIPESDPNLRWDYSESRGEKFAHYYARLPKRLITSIEPFRI